VPPRPLTLRDGTRLIVRPIAPEDREQLREGFERLSPESRYRRFFSPVPRLSERHLDYLTDVDHHDHEALVAVEASSGRGVGVARYVRTDEQEAEPAMAVADDWQGRGVGGHLLMALADRAREEGIVRFRAPVLASNQDALTVLGRLGPTQATRVGSEVDLRIDLAPPAAARPSLLRWLRAAADGTISPGLTVLQRLASGARLPPLDRAVRDVIVVGTDGSDGPVLRAAAVLARQLGCSLQLIWARRPIAETPAGVEPALALARRRLRRDGLEVEVHLRRGDAVAAVVDLATEQQARLIVVGASRRSAEARLLPGGVADSIARQAPCDVLLVRSRT
jgi:nucleotide-binding universal stress UspA family protein/GNAT superfamily N-acetyltransferase